MNVQPRIFRRKCSGRCGDKIDSYYYDRSSEALAPAEKLLRVAHIVFASHRAVGPIAETIAEKRRELDCDAIVMGSRGHGKVGVASLLGLVAAQVLHLADVPVTVITDNMRPDFSGRRASHLSGTLGVRGCWRRRSIERTLALCTETSQPISGRRARRRAPGNWRVAAARARVTVDFLGAASEQTGQWLDAVPSMRCDE